MRKHQEQVTVSRTMGVMGTLGTITCAATMLLAAAGVLGVGAASTGSSSGMSGMAGMDAHGASTIQEAGGITGFLLREGHVILLVSIGAMVLSLAIGRRAAALPGLAAGAILDWGMYRQDDTGLIDAAIVGGLATWAAAYL